MEKEIKKEQKYIAIVSALENGKLQIRFPDFEGLMGTAETEEIVETSAALLLDVKIQELKSLEIELPEATSVLEIAKELKPGEFTCFVHVKKDYLAQGKVLGKMLQSKLEKSGELKSDQMRILGFVGGALLLLSLFLPVFDTGIVNFNIGYFSKLFGGGEILDFIPKENFFMLRMVGFLILFEAIFVIYSYWKEKILYMFISSILAIPLFILHLLMRVIVPGKFGNLGRQMGMSYANFTIFLAAVVLAVAAYVLFTKHKEEILS